MVYNQGAFRILLSVFFKTAVSQSEKKQTMILRQIFSFEIFWVTLLFC